MVVSTPSPLGPLFRTRYRIPGWRVLLYVLLNQSQVQSLHLWVALIMFLLMAVQFQDCAGSLKFIAFQEA